jgi:hypothetical protein
MRREFQVIDQFGHVTDTVMVDVPATATLDEATAEAKAEHETYLRGAYDANEQYKADSVIANIREYRWVMPLSYAG